MEKCYCCELCITRRWVVLKNKNSKLSSTRGNLFSCVWQVRIDSSSTRRPMEDDLEMTSDRENRGDLDGIDPGPRTQPLEAKSVPFQLAQFMDQIAGQLDILTQVNS